MTSVNRLLSGLGLSPILQSPYEWVATVVDIVVVAYLLYKIAAWIRDTRAWSLFKGLLVIIVVYVVAGVFKLNTIKWIVDNTLSVGIIAIIVLFQPELRKALEQLGRNKIVSMFRSSGDVEVDGELAEKGAEEIVNACMLMAKVKTGALIVVQRAVGLMELEATGIEIDAAISRQLLINIFEDKTPLHDGAVIIKGGRIAAATCIMPLTAAQIGSELGTRHRAAVGVSEVSDAVVIVVSEETGVISMARNGELYRNMSDKDLRRVLSEGREPSKRKLFKRGKLSGESHE